jgi:endonuclease-8
VCSPLCIAYGENVPVPEGDSLHRAAQRLQVLVGEPVEVEAPNPRASGKGIAERLDGLRLERVEAVGKNLLLSFEGGHVLRSHLRMTGRWRVSPRGAPRTGLPWLVIRGREHEAVLWNGPVLELDGRRLDGLGPDILEAPPALDRMIANLRRDPTRPVGDAILDQRLVAGIGNIWKAECLWAARVSPWARIETLGDDELRAVLEEAHRLMRTGLEGARPLRRVYRRVGRPCPRCGEAIRSRGQGDDNRMAYWCPACQQAGEAAPSA